MSRFRHIDKIFIFWQDRFNLIEMGRKMLTNSWRVISNSTSGRLTLKVKKNDENLTFAICFEIWLFWILLKCYFSFGFLTFYIAEILPNLTKILDTPGRVIKDADFRDFMLWREDGIGVKSIQGVFSEFFKIKFVSYLSFSQRDLIDFFEDRHYAHGFTVYLFWINFPNFKSLIVLGKGIIGLKVL